jgi:hypothetical protein
VCKSTFVTKIRFEFGQYMARLAKVPTLTTLLNVPKQIFLFVSLQNWNKCVCQNFRKQEIVSISGMAKFFFSKRLVAILTRGFSRSCFTNPSTNNLELDDLFEYLWQRSSHVCLSTKSNTWILISFLEYFFYRNSLH